MVDVIAQFFNIISVDVMPPSTLSELIQWIMIILTGLTLVSGVFGVFGKLMELILRLTYWSGR